MSIRIHLYLPGHAKTRESAGWPSADTIKVVIMPYHCPMSAPSVSSLLPYPPISSQTHNHAKRHPLLRRGVLPFPNTRRGLDARIHNLPHCTLPTKSLPSRFFQSRPSRHLGPLLLPLPQSPLLVLVLALLLQFCFLSGCFLLLLSLGIARIPAPAASQPSAPLLRSVTSERLPLPEPASLPSCYQSHPVSRSRHCSTFVGPCGGRRHLHLAMENDSEAPAPHV